MLRTFRAFLDALRSRVLALEFDKAVSLVLAVCVRNDDGAIDSAKVLESLHAPITTEVYRNSISMTTPNACIKLCVFVRFVNPAKGMTSMETTLHRTLKEIRSRSNGIRVCADGSSDEPPKC